MSPTLLLDEELVRRLPLPLAQLYRRAHNTKTLLEGHLTAFYTWEAALKLMASASVVTYARQPNDDPKLFEHLKGLARPALGHWWDVIRSLLPILAGRGTAGYAALCDILLGRTRDDLPRTAGLDAALREVLGQQGGGRSTVRLSELFARLLKYRNKLLGHGAPAQLKDDVHRGMTAALLLSLAELLARVDVLAGRRLLHIGEVRQVVGGAWLVQRYELAGERPRRVAALELPREAADRLPEVDRVYLEGPAASGAGEELTLLHPLLFFEAETEQVLFLNSRCGKRGTEYLCYTTGKSVERADAGGEQRELLARILGMAVSPAEAAVWAEQSQAEEAEGEAPKQMGMRRIGEYELLSELGRGGMGVVYRAWQPSLGRQVALKRLLHGGEPKADARFRREIRALGKVDHPHVVKVHTSGSDGEHFYYTMELVEGVPLSAVTETLTSGTSSVTEVDLPCWHRALSTACAEARRVEKPLTDTTAAQPHAELAAPLPGMRTGRDYVRHVVELVRQTAEAAHALHEAGIIHRDIKPGNILVDPAGTQAVLMDLGLAQLADDVEGRLTRTRQFVGTLRYASPEQVLSVGELDRRSDVYSLGATLWELLTLRPLYGADEQTPTPELMRRIQYQEPASLRKYHRGVPRDLDAIVLKCLEKDAGRRYASAAALAEDLGRFQAGEPITARPAGWLERALKWARRRPAQAALILVSVAAGLTLLIGGAWFTWQVDQARHLAENRAAERQQALEAVEETTAVGLLRPLGHQHLFAPLNGVELDSLWELARLPRARDRVRLLFIERAMDQGGTAAQLQWRLDMALLAAVGLDPDRRSRVSEALLRRLGDPEADWRVRRACFLAGLALDADEVEFTRAVAPHLAALIIKNRNNGGDHSDRRLSDALETLGKQSDPERAGAVRALAAFQIAQALPDTRDVWRLKALSEALVPLAAKLSPEESRMVAIQITRTLTTLKEPEQFAVASLSAVLVALSGRLDPDSASAATVAAAGPLMLGSNPNPHELAGLCRVLAGRLSPDGARAAAAGIVRGLETIKEPYALRAVSEALAVVAGRLSPSDARGACAPAFARLTGLLLLAEDRDLPNLAGGLAALAERLDRKEVRDACAAAIKALTAAMPRAKGRELLELAQTLPGLADRLPSPFAGTARIRAAEEVIKALAGAGSVDERDLLETLTLLVAQLEPAEAATVAGEISRVFSAAEPRLSRKYLSGSLALLTGRISAETGREISEAMTKTLAADLHVCKDRFLLAILCEEQSALADWLGAERARAACAPFAARLGEAFTQAREDQERDRLTEALAALEKWCGPSHRRQAVAAIHRALDQAEGPAELARLSKNLAAVVGRLGADEARAACDLAVIKLAAALPRIKGKFAVTEPCETLAALAGKLSRIDAWSEKAQRQTEALAGKLSPDAARTAAADVKRAFDQAEDPLSLGQLSVALAALAGRLGGDEARALCDPLAVRVASAFTRRKSYNDTEYLSAGLLALAGTISPDRARAAANAVTQVMTEDLSAFQLADLARTLAALEGQLGADEASAACAPAAARLIEALAMTDRENDRKELLHALGSVVERLDRGHAVELLKHPTCVGPSRAILLRRLGRLCDRTFATVWDLVEYLREHEPGINLSSPAKLMR